MSEESIVDIASYLRANANELGSRILSTFPPLRTQQTPLRRALQPCCARLYLRRRW